MALKILLNGCRGRMGLAIQEVAPALHAEISCACDEGDDPSSGIAACDVVIDFSFHEVTASIATLAAENGKPLVIGTTGHSPAERDAITQAVESRIPVVWAGNYSVGVNTLNYLTRKAAEIVNGSFEAEVLEMHHHHKTDAPSGTAARLLEILKEVYKVDETALTHGREGNIGARPKNEIGVHAIRGGDIVGEHTVFFCGNGERIELTHRATDRRIFAEGAVRAAQWLVEDRQPKIYTMEDVLGLV